MRTILVFDSGIGGLSIYRPLMHRLPQDQILYFADSSNFPYGNKTASWLRSRFTVLASEFAHLNLAALVVACNSATVNAIDIFRSKLMCPIIGVEPVIKPLSGYSQAVALMTAVSASSIQTKNLLIKYGEHVKVYTPTGLAEAIEYNDYTQVKKILTKLARYIRINQIKAVGLSCTHYPLILPELKRRFPGIEFVDPSLAVVRQVERVLRLTQ